MSTSGMSMTLHGGDREFILFAFWKTGSTLGMACSMLIVILMCILFEALKALRLFLAKIQASKIKARSVSARPVSPVDGGSEHAEASSSDSLNILPVLRLTGNGKLLTAYRVLQALLYAVQAALAYALMLIVMTFNIWLVVAVVLGEAVGYFLFTGEPLVSEVSHCS